MVDWLWKRIMATSEKIIYCCLFQGTFCKEINGGKNEKKFRLFLD